MEQLVELTKRFYVEKKAEQLADKLDKLSDKQEKLAKIGTNQKNELAQLRKDCKGKLADDIEAGIVAGKLL